MLWYVAQKFAENAAVDACRRILIISYLELSTNKYIITEEKELN